MGSIISRRCLHLSSSRAVRSVSHLCSRRNVGFCPLATGTPYTPISGISISPTSGHLLTLIPTARVTISNLPCTNTFFLFSGHVYGGGSVIPTTVAWSCTQQATPTPTSKPTPLPTRQPTPTPTLTIQPTLIPTQQPTPILTSQSSPKPNAPSRTAIPKGTDVPLATPTMLVSPTPILPSVSKEKPPTRGKNSSSTDMFTVVSIIFDVVIALVALILFAVFMKRRMFKVR